MHNIQSPRSDEAAVEQEIQAKGLTKPRITPQHIDEQIVSTYFFTAEDGVTGEENANSWPPAVYESSLGLLTFCVLVLRNGFMVTGESACASPENFDAEIGKKIAFTNAREKIWLLEGYLLRDWIHANEQTTQKTFAFEQGLNGTTAYDIEKLVAAAPSPTVLVVGEESGLTD